jgi:hypothetical protein
MRGGIGPGRPPPLGDSQTASANVHRIVRGRRARREDVADDRLYSLHLAARAAAAHRPGRYQQQERKKTPANRRCAGAGRLGGGAAASHLCPGPGQSTKFKCPGIAGRTSEIHVTVAGLTWHSLAGWHARGQ